MNKYDFIIVGSGINSLVCAALLAKKGHKVIVLERNDRLGGCIRTEEITLPGFKHDVLSCWHPLFVTSPAYAALKDDLHNNGLEYLNTDTPTAALLPDNRFFILKRSREENIKNMQTLATGDGAAYTRAMQELEQTADLSFGLLGNELWSWSTLRLLLTEVYKNGLHGLAAYFGHSLQSCRAWLDKEFNAAEVKACIAPWVLHTGLGPESSVSAHMARLICFTLEQAGMPVVKGGSYQIVVAFQRVIEANGGVVCTNVDVNKILVRDNTAIGVSLLAGQEYFAAKAVICNVTPTQLYQRLLDAAHVPANIAEQTANYTYGRGDMQIHLALNEAPAWPDPALNDVAMVHVTPGLDGVSRAVNEAERGLLPDTATICVGQPTVLDPSRAPDGKWILWLQLQELPRSIKGDAAAEIETPVDGCWNEQVREAYADRIVERLCRHIPNLKRAIIGRCVLSPVDLENMNINLVGGDPYSGAASLEQFLLWRPLRATKNHTTPVKRLYHIGASTHPGAGLGGVSGYLVAGIF